MNKGSHISRDSGFTQAEVMALLSKTKKYGNAIDAINQTIQDLYDNIGNAVQSAMPMILNAAYPVGSYYWSSDNTSPALLFGGTWEQVKDKFVLAAGDTYTADATGGEATHTLTVDEMPSHIHGSYYRARYTATGSTWGIDPGTRGDWNDGVNVVQPTGGDQAHNNMPPYIVAYCWHRVA